MRRSEAREVLRAVRWLEERAAAGEDIDREVWDRILLIMRTAPAARTQLHAAQVLADRFDPEPRPAIAVTGPTQVNVTWQAPSPSSSPTDPDPSSNGSTVRFADGT